MTDQLTDDDRLAQFKKDISDDADTARTAAEAAEEDMRFVNVAGGMWEDFHTDDFDDRTKMEFDLASNYLNRFVGEWNQNRVGVVFEPDDDLASDDDAELLNGIYRADFRQNSGKVATDNAVNETATCGYGCFELAATFEDDLDPENENQNVEWRVINNAYNSVFWDNAAKRIDKRDARRVTKLIQFTDQSFEETFPDASPVSAYTPETRLLFKNDFFSPTFVYVGVRYEVMVKDENFFVYNDLENSKVIAFTEEEHKEKEAELKKNDLMIFVRERRIPNQFIEMTVFSGQEILESTKRIAGKWLPLIPLYGYRAYVDGRETYRGVVRKLKDPSRMFNMQVSQLGENAASGGQDLPIFTHDQIAGYENDWADRNNKSYLLLNPAVDDDGNIVATAPTEYLKPAQLDGSTAALLQIVPQFIKDVTGGAPQDTVDPNLSGKAIRALQKRVDMNTQVINDNIANGIEWSGTVYQSMRAELQTSRRTVNTIGMDGTVSREELLKQVIDDDSGRVVEVNNLNGKKFSVYADVGAQYDTLREETTEDIKGMLDTIGQVKGGEQYLPVMLSALFENMTGVGMKPLKDLNRRIMILSGQIKPKTDEEKEMVAQQQQAQQQEDPQQKLIEAAANQQNAEAENLQADSLNKVATAEKTAAQTREIIVDTEIAIDEADLNEIKTLMEVRESVLGPTTRQVATLQ